LESDLAFNNDFGGTYSTISDQWIGVDPVFVSNGKADFTNLNVATMG